MVSLVDKPAADNPGSDRADSRLQPLEVEVIQLFVQLSRVLGQPRSLGEIYGLLFISPRPLAMDDLMDRLKLSKGSASQGLKFLRNLGAVQMVYVPGERRVHYEAVAELRKLVSSFLRETIEPHLGEGKQRLERLRVLADALPAEDREWFGRRIALLQSWGERSGQFVPLIVKLLGG